MPGSASFLGRLTVPVVLALIVYFEASAALGGPSFVTDPEPVEYKHGEFYVASQTSHNADGTSGTLPHFEFNYGPLPDMQLHIITPFAYNKPRGGSMQWGYGDTELGSKCRLVHETEQVPQVGVFPFIDLPLLIVKMMNGPKTTIAGRNCQNALFCFFLKYAVMKILDKCNVQ